MNPNHIFKTALLSTPLVVASLMVNFGESQTVKASEIRFKNNSQVVASGDRVQVEFPSLEKNEFGDLIIDFTEEESDEAVRLFGCDCLSSINALRKMRGIARGVEGELLTPDTQIAACPHRLFIGV